MTSGLENDMKMRKGEGQPDFLPERLDFELTVPPLHWVDFKDLMKRLYTLDSNARFGDTSFGAWGDADTDTIETDYEQMHVRFKCRLDEANEFAGYVALLGRQKFVRVVARSLEDISSYISYTKLVYQRICTYKEMYDSSEEQRQSPQFAPPIFAPPFKALLTRAVAKFNGYTVKYIDEPPMLEVDVDRTRVEEFYGFAREEGWEVSLIGQVWYVPATEAREDFFKISETDE